MEMDVQAGGASSSSNNCVASQDHEGNVAAKVIVKESNAVAASQSSTNTNPVAPPSRRFLPDGKVTSVDLTPDGTYVIAGCSDGTIRLYSMVSASSWGREGLILGQIHAKGLITNLIFHVEVSSCSLLKRLFFTKD